jgi:hypothetical protein
MFASVTWLKAAAMRAVKTAAQVATALIVTDVTIWKLNWAQIGGVAATAAVLSLLTSLAGLPELSNSSPSE